MITPLEVKLTLLNQIEQCLHNKIEKSEFAYLAEQYYSENACFIEHTDFFEIYKEIIPDACLFYVDEPGTESEKEKHFYAELREAYELLKPLCP
ncbi:MAG: hypothetical protein IJC09_07205 [Clostridia bacterium]|nr:hypothetical protein [Clostridia bacterium]